MDSVISIPELSIVLGGTPLLPREAATLGRTLVQQRLSFPSLMELSFFEPPESMQQRSAATLGSAVRATLAGWTTPLFEGEITAMEWGCGPSGERTLRLRAYDLTHRLRKRQPVRAHVGVTTADLARELAGPIGLEVSSAIPGPRWPRLLQGRQTDFDLLAEICDRSGLQFTVRGGVLHLLTLEGLDEATGPLILGDRLLEASVEANGETSCRTAVARGWDPILAEKVDARVTVPRTARRVPAEAPPDRMRGEPERTVVDRVFQDDAQAEATAQAELDDRTAREVVLRGVAAGDPELRPGTRVTVRGLPPVAEGRYLLSAVTHRIDSRHGYVSEISTELPARRPQSHSVSATLGTVTGVDDPERRCRVQVSLPALGDLDGGWMEVVTLAAGAGKGFVALPSMGDRVLVFFISGDPAPGLVLGGLYGGEEPLDRGVDGGSVKRYTCVTPGGQKLVLDDSGRRIRLETSEGSYVELAPELVRMHSRTALEIAAPGKPIVIKGASIDFEEA